MSGQSGRRKKKKSLNDLLVVAQYGTEQTSSCTSQACSTATFDMQLTYKELLLNSIDAYSTLFYYTIGMIVESGLYYLET